MQVRDRFAGIAAVIDHDAIAAFRDAFEPGHGARGEEQSAEQFGIEIARFAEPGEMPLGNDQDVERRLRIRVMKSDQVVGFMDDPGRNFSGGDFFKNGH